MTRLSTTNIQADGIGDVFEDLSGSGRNSAVDIGTVDTYQDRSPLLNGSTRTGRQPQGAIQYNDFRSSFAVEGGFGTYTTGIGKDSVSHTVTGWGTAGGIAAATSNNLSSQMGTLLDGTTSYTTSAKPFDQLNSSFDSNKWISAIVTDASIEFFTNIVILKIVFEGGGANTGDTDWTTLNFKKDGQYNASGSLDYTSQGAGGSQARTGMTVTTVSNRIVYTVGLASGIGPADRYFSSGGNTLGFKTWIQFV